MSGETKSSENSPTHFVPSGNLDRSSFIRYHRRMNRPDRKRNRKGEGSLFAYNGYWFYTYGYTIEGEYRKKKRCLGPVEKFRTEAAAWTEAKSVRDQFITDVKTGKVVKSEVGNVTCGELLNQYIAHLHNQSKPSAYVIEKCVEANIRPFFGSKKVAKLQTSDFEQYRKMRTKTVCNATVDHDFAYLKSALILEYKKTPSRVTRVPHIQKSGEDKVRQGFLELDGYEKVLTQLPLSLKSVFVVGYHIGNRKGVLLDLKWPQVDFKNGVIRFIGMQNRKPVPVAAPIYGDMEGWLRRQKEFRDEHFPRSNSFSSGTQVTAKSPQFQRKAMAGGGMKWEPRSSRFTRPGRTR